MPLIQLFWNYHST